VRIDALPSDALVLLDGKPVGTGSASFTLPEDGKDHLVRVEAAGHAPRERTLRPDDRSLAWSVELKPQKAGTTGTGTSAGTTGAASVPPTPAAPSKPAAAEPAPPSTPTTGTNPPPAAPKSNDTKCSKKGRCISTSYEDG
jgi:hypothetical protein